ncbi:MAG: DUF6807 family protein [Limisphaerales bacterium]
MKRAWGILVASGIGLATAMAGESFRFVETTPQTLTVFEGQRPVLAYNHGLIQPPSPVPAHRARSTYIHPLYGLDGEVLTDDFPEDHLHHRGLFWGWPHVRVGNQHHDLWLLSGIENRFLRWTSRKADETAAVLTLENGWFVGERQVMSEQCVIRVSPAEADSRAIDLEFTWTPLDEPMTLQGAEGKSYGGLTLRYAPRRETVITTPLGQGKDDITITHLPWADLSATFAGTQSPSGAAVFVAPDHPGFPPEWLTRHYGALCVGWPGVQAKTFPSHQPFRCRYRIWVHRGVPDVQRVQKAFDDFASHTTKEPLLTAPPRPGR